MNSELEAKVTSLISKSKETSVSNSDLLELLQLIEEMERRHEYGGIIKRFQPNTPYAIDCLPKHKAFFDATNPYREVLLLGGNRSGKALPNWEEVFTPSGPVKIDSLRVGDSVISSTGKPCKVTGVFPQEGLRNVYKVSTTDGATIHADAEHLWSVRDISQGKSSKFVVKTTKQLLEEKKRWALPTRPIVEFNSKNVPIDPYLLGILLGDGGLSNGMVSFSTVDAFLLDRFTELVSAWNLEIKKHGACTYRAASSLRDRGGHGSNPLYTKLRELGCARLSINKSIPNEYLINSSENRLSLLQGLMDTDGTLDKNGKASFYSSSESLAEDVAFLARSLGINATISSKQTRCDGEWFLSWVVYLGATTFPIVTLPRKLSRWKAPVHSRVLAIETIEYVGEDSCTCISVDSDDNLFLAKDFILTHNTQSGAYVCAVIATGLYPDWWEGMRFDGPVNIWAVGKTGQTTRDTVQEALMGPVGAEGTGLIPLNCIGKKVRLPGTPNAYDTVEVMHVSGKWSTIGFKSYKQETPSFYGTARHLVWLDEPCPEDIYNECLIRTSVLPGGGEGRVIHTITPKEGLTRLLADFLSNCDLLAGTEKIPGIDKAAAMMQLEDADGQDAIKILYGDQTAGTKARHHRATVAIGWSDIPWMSDQAKNEILESTPPHLRETVSEGIPSVGDGAVYQYPLESILLKNSEVFPIPDHFEKLYGMDASWNCTCAIFGARDPNTGVVYIYGEHYMGQRDPEVHAARIKAIAGDWMPGAIDPAAGKLKGPDGKEFMTMYRNLGLRLREANNSREAGILKVAAMIGQGKLKFFPNTYNLQNEYLMYHRERGAIVKEKDHAMDALRYLVVSMHMAKVAPIGGSKPFSRLIKAPPSRPRYNV